MRFTLKWTYVFYPLFRLIELSICCFEREMIFSPADFYTLTF